MPGPKKKPAKKAADLPALAKQLVAEPRQKANNLPVLLAALKPECAEATPVLHNLRIFFIDSFDRGDLSVKPPPPEDKSAEAVYAAWLHRQYTAYQAALLRLLGDAAADARTQVSAFVALMECVRGEQPGVFNNRLYHRILARVVGSGGSAPEVLGLLISKFLGLADVRYFTLSSIIKLAQQAQQAQQGRASGPAAGAAEVAAGDEVEGDAAAGEGEEEGGSVGMDDLARTLHDLLVEMPAFGAAPPKPAAAKSGSGDGSSDDDDDDDEGDEGVEEEEEGEGAAGLRSWCGAAEVGIAVAANAGEGARQRKRQRLMQQEQQQGGEQQRVKWANGKAQQRMYSDAWLALLRLPLPEDILKKVLARTHDLIVPSLVNPLLLADFLTATLDKGGLHGMLALNGIFLLVTRHGLEYPRFYHRLYQLLTPDAFHAKHRSRFFALADVFLASGMVPAYTAAAFVKRLARLALAAPPAGALLSLAFMHNIVRRHPATMQLLHRPPRGGLAGVAAGAASPAAPQPLLPLPPQVAGSSGLAAPAAAAANGVAANGSSRQQHKGQQQQQQGQQQQQQGQQGPAWQGVDVFDYNEPDPGKSRALESSLWELEALRQHANPQVAAACALLDKDLRDRKKTSEADIGELLTASYASMFGAEAGRRLKAVPTAFYRQPPEQLFAANCAPDFAGWAL